MAYNCDTFWESIPRSWIIDGIYHWNIITSELRFSPEYYTIAGYEPYEFPEHYDEWEKRIHPDDLQKVLTRSSLFLNGQTSIYNEVFRFLTKNGDWMWIRARATMVERDENGKPKIITGTHRDISSEMVTAQSLQESDNTFRSVVQNSQPIIFMYDKTGKILLNEGKSLASIGLQPNELVGKNVLDLYKDDLSTIDVIKRTLKGEQQEYTSYIGDTVLESISTPIYDDRGKVNAVVGMSIDRACPKSIQL